VGSISMHCPPCSPYAGTHLCPGLQVLGSHLQIPWTTPLPHGGTSVVVDGSVVGVGVVGIAVVVGSIHCPPCSPSAGTHICPGLQML